MRNTVEGRLALVALFAALTLVFSVHIVTQARRYGWTRLVRSSMRYVVGTVLLTGGVVCSVLKPAPLWAPILTIILLTYGLLMTYGTAVYVLENRPPRLHRHALTWWVTALLSATTIFDVLRGNNRGNFVDNEPYVPTATYFIANMLAVACLLVLEASIAGVYWRSVRANHALTSVAASTYTLRRSTGLIAFSLGAAGLFVFEVRLVCAMLGVASPLLDQVFLISESVVPVLAVTLFLLSIATTWPYLVIARLIHWVVIRRRRDAYALLAYLQQRMLQVVPTVPHVELADPQLRWGRALSEIADAREVLWSDADRSTPITPDTEAARLFRLLHAGHQYGADIPTGRSLHLPIGDARMVEHNLAVARALQRLEQHAACMTKDDIHADA